MKKEADFLDYVNDLYRGLRSHKILLSYEGEINHRIMKLLINIAENEIATSDSSETKQKVFHVIVETLQNMTKHAAVHNPGNENSSVNGIICISRDEKQYHITTGNIIEPENRKKLTDILDYTNQLSLEELDIHYKKQLKEGHLSEKGGAGLGFIDIRRRTKMKMSYGFYPLDDSFLFFLLKSTITRNA